MTKDTRSCGTCIHHDPSTGFSEVSTLCWDCTSFKTLVHWEPKVTTRRITVTPRPKELKLSLADYIGKLSDVPPPPPVFPVALDVQVGGNHYKKLKIQPMEYSMANELDACQHTAIKYVTRFRDKGTPIEDLDKAIHAIELLKDFYLKETKDVQAN